MYLIINKSTSPYFNLALEEYALTEMDRDMIILWRNSKAVIVGKNQNTIEEVDVDFVTANAIPVVRRQSGGGAVFHDPGNVNFTVIHDKGEDDFDNYAKFTAPIVAYLDTLGVKAELSGRNDLAIDGRKFCGNAQAAKGGRIMHHGCILYSADFGDLANSLKPRDIKLESKGVKSVRKRVTNIAEHMASPMSADDFFLGLAEYFMNSTAGIERYELTGEDIARTQRLADDKYSTWEWNYGRSPAYNMHSSRRYDFGIVEAAMTVEGSIVKDINITGDFFGELDKSGLEELIRGTRHERDAIKEALSNTALGSYISGMTTDLLLELLC